METVYLAVPYSGTREQRQERYLKVNKKANELMQEGYRVFSPISHSHEECLLGNFIKIYNYEQCL